MQFVIKRWKFLVHVRKASFVNSVLLWSQFQEASSTKSQNVKATHVSTDRWMDKQNSIYAYNGIYSTWKRNEILSHPTIWINFEDTRLSEISQLPKDKYYVIPLIWGMREVRFIEMESRMPGSERRENGEMLFNRCGVSVFQYKKVLEVDCTMMCIQLTLLNSKLTNSYNGKFHSMCFLP